MVYATPQIDIVGTSIGILGIVIGIIVSYYLYRKSIRIKSPHWGIRSNNLIQRYTSKLSELQVTYKDERVENLTISKLIFWNEGAETLNRQDILTANPIRIVGRESVLLLDTKVLSSNNPSSKFSIKLEKRRKHATIDFDYLDHKQGTIIQVVHNGTSSEDLSITGDIKGVTKIVKESLEPKHTFLGRILLFKSKKRIIKEFSFIVSLTIGVVYAFLSIIILFIAIIDHVETDLIGSAIIIGIAGCFMIYTSYSAWRPFNSVPKALKTLYENEPH